MSLCLMLIADVTPHIGEEVDNLRETLVEVEPTFFRRSPACLGKNRIADPGQH